MKRSIKFNYVDGSVGYTDVTGTDKEIINYYNDSNFLGSFSEEYVQINSIEIPVFESELLPGQKAGTRIYMFEYNQKAECYLY